MSYLPTSIAHKHAMGFETYIRKCLIMFSTDTIQHQDRHYKLLLDL